MCEFPFLEHTCLRNGRENSAGGLDNVRTKITSSLRACLLRHVGRGAERTGWRNSSSGYIGYGRSKSGTSSGTGQPDSEQPDSERHAPADRHWHAPDGNRPRLNLAKTGDAGQQYTAFYDKSEYAEYSRDCAQRLAVWIVAGNPGRSERRFF